MTRPPRVSPLVSGVKRNEDGVGMKDWRRRGCHSTGSSEVRSVRALGRLFLPWSRDSLSRHEVRKDDKVYGDRGKGGRREKER